jgi:hypothetical protein
MVWPACPTSGPATLMAGDTAEFAVNAVRRWHQVVGSVRYPKADQVLITADGGGSNGSRVRLWKLQLQKLADETGLQVCRYPPVTSSILSGTIPSGPGRRVGAVILGCRLSGSRHGLQHRIPQLIEPNRFV